MGVPGPARPLVVVDLANMDAQPAALLSAAENEGFFYLVNHGVPQHEIDAAFELSRRFFAAPDDVKRQTRGDTSNAHYVLGYTTEELEEGTMRQGLLCGARPVQPAANAAQRSGGGALLCPTGCTVTGVASRSRAHAHLWVALCPLCPGSARQLTDAPPVAERGPRSRV